jgi:cobalt-zinc-cadmium efflux system outer membrane protein
MGERAPDFERVAGDLASPPDIADLDAITKLLENSPELERFADERRLREARLQLAKAKRAADWEWKLGVRRLEETDDWAAVAGLSIPIGSRSRSAPSVRAAQADLEQLEFERSAQELSLHATLAEAHAQLISATTEMRIADQEVLPAFRQAEEAAERAYTAGALNYLDWAQLQADHSSMRRERLVAAAAAHRALIEIQRLTGRSFDTTAAAQQPKVAR